MEALPSAWPFQQRLKSTSFNHQSAAASASLSRAGRRLRRAEAAPERPTPPLAALNQAAVSADGASLELVWDDGARSSFHWEWLLDNCFNNRDPATTQKTRSIVEYELESAAEADLAAGVGASAARTRLRMAGASLSEIAASDDLCGGILTVHWSEGSESTFDGRWLRVLSSLPSSSAAPPPAAPWTDSASPLSTALHSSAPVPTVAYEDVMGAEEPVFTWTHELVRSGLCVITGVPQEPSVVTKVASRVAPVLPTLYGTSFDVRVEGQPINIAYTDKALRPHQDLPYYESPPGLQFLHCIQFDKTVIGGDSVFYDTFVLAQLLRERDPDAFETLCTVPATFQKNHLDREQPAQMFYRRPIISVNSRKDVVGVFWSPAFEGPLVLDGPLRDDPRAVAEYYAAYRAFGSLLEDPEVQDAWKISFRLEPGQMVTFNQRRMLHGREAFSSHAGMRWLQGCYVGIDEFTNRFRTLNLQFGEGRRGLESAARVGNQCWR